MPEQLHRFLSSLGDPDRRPIPARNVAVVVAHPDDETIGCGALLRRLDGVSIIVVSDGAPRNLADARANGFDSAAEYATARRSELREALALCADDHELVELAIADQETPYRISAIAGSLAKIFAERETSIVLTHAYEGGHPDHDATALAVTIASRLIALRAAPPAVAEMPFYRLGPAGMLAQRFDDRPDAPEISVALSEPERELKRQMLAAHRTQRRTLAPLGADVERFRPAPEREFSALPNGGDLLYERHDWGMTGERWLQLAHAGLTECGLPAIPTWA